MNKMIACLIAAAIPVSVAASPAIDAQKDHVIVTNGGHKAALSLTNGRIELRTPYHTYHLQVSILNNGAWTEPAPAVAAPVTHTANGSAYIEVTYPVADNRQFTIGLSAYQNLPGIYMISKLKNLGKLRSDYYFWSWDVGFKSYFVPGKNNPEEITPDLQSEVRFGRHDWVYLPCDNGGLAVFTNGTLGRSPGADSGPFLNALPINQVIDQGQSMNMGIGFVGTASPKEAAHAYSALTGKKIAALQVKPTIPKFFNIDYGKPAPKWAQRLDKYNIFPWIKGTPENWTGAEIKDWLSNFVLVESVPGDKGVIERCHKAGLRVVMYVNFMEMLDSAVQRQVGAKGEWYLHENWEKGVGHELVDLHDHPNWIGYNEQGKPMQSIWGVQTNVPGLFNTCLHQPDLHKMALKQLKKVLDMGVDGIFIDNASPIRDCYGDKFGKHSHPDPNKTNTDMYMQLLREVYQFVKSYGNDKVVMHNSGFRPEQWAFCDIEMWESAIYGSGVSQRMNGWDDLQYAAELQTEAIKHGKVPVILDYFLDQPKDVRMGHALYSYAFARLYDIGWGDWFTLMGNEGDAKDFKAARGLYSVHLGNPTSKVLNSGEVYYRTFENGIALVNTAKSSGVANIHLARSGSLTDVGCNRTLTAAGGKLKVDIGPEMGRILIWRQPSAQKK